METTRKNTISSGINSRKESIVMVLSKRSRLFQGLKLSEKDEELKRTVVVMKKDKKSLDEIAKISLFLQSMQGLFNVIATAYPNNHSNIFNKVAYSIKYDPQNAKRLIFRYGNTFIDLGDQSEKFYVILKGSVSILMPSEIEVIMTLTDLLIFLSKLRDKNELELIKNVMESNQQYLSTINRKILETNDMRSFRVMKSINEETIKNYSLKMGDNDENIGLEDYINELKPCTKEQIQEEKYSFVIYEYNLVKTLFSGEIFGDSSMTSVMNKR